MAVDFDVKGSRTSEYRFLPEMLVVDPKMNGRYELPDIQWIIDSILLYGQLSPVTIRRVAGKPVLVFGFSRWRAVSEINKRKLTEKPLELRCVYTALTEKQAYLANIEENRVRNATTPMDDAYNIQRLINVFQMSIDEVKAAYRAESTAWVKNRLALIEATPAVEKQIRKGTIKGPAARTIAKLTKEHQDNLAKVAEEKGKITPADIQAETGVTPAKKEAAPVVAPDEEKFSKLVSLAIELARGVIADNVEFVKMERLAFEVLAAAGLKK